MPLTAGLTMHLVISASGTTLAPNFILDYPILTRNCRSLEERPPLQTLFSTYSPEACRYECALAKVVHSYGCVPWDIPFGFRWGETRICPGRQAFFFKRELFKQLNQECEECDGLPLCNGVDYQTKVGKCQNLP